MTRDATLTRTAIVGCALLVAAMAPTTPASAQSRTGFAISRYEPAERGSEWFVVDGIDARARTLPTLGATLDHAYKPLVVYDAAQNEQLALVRHQLFLHLGASIFFAERLRLGVNLPVAVYQDGDDALVNGEPLKAATAPAFGDVRLAADVRVAGGHRDPLTLALGVRAWFPTGLRSQFTSDGSVRIGPQVLLAGKLGVFTWAARGALVYRARDDAYAGTPLGTELTGAIGGGVRMGSIVVGPEVFAATRIDGDAFLRTHGTPVDAVLGFHAELASGLRLGAALGAGLTRGYGSPAFRALASLDWEASAGTGTGDTSVPLPDRDHDAIVDASDACPDVPGIRSGDPERNGCPDERVPDEDTDGDRIWDRDDACPALAGIPSTEPMRNGCPPTAPTPLAMATASEIRIGEQVQFATASAELLAASDAVLSAVKRVLDDHPDIRSVRVEGHTDDTGEPSYNDDLSRRRAAAVVAWLVAHGIDATRLASEGFASRLPIDTNTTEAGRARNRRVVFTILERAPPAR